MKTFVGHFSAFLVVLILAAFCASVVCVAASDKKAEEILRKTYEKYTDLLKKSGNDIKSVAAKITIKGGGELPMGDSGGGMPLNLDATLELYFAQPRNLYVGLTGNLGNAIAIVTGEAKKVATIILPGTKQFAKIDVPEEVMEDMDEASEEPPPADEVFKDANLTYDGTAETKLGKAHKIKVQSNNPESEEGTVTVYILDGKWDPVRVDISAEEKANLVIEFEKLEINEKISGNQFVPNTQGYAEISQDELVTVIGMQIMGAMMQGGGME